MAYYKGMRIGEIWGFEVDGLFATDEEAQQYTTQVLDCSGYISSRMTGGFLAGDLRYVDLDNDGHYQIDADGHFVLDENGNKILLPEDQWRVLHCQAAQQEQDSVIPHHGQQPYVQGDGVVGYVHS